MPTIEDLKRIAEVEFAGIVKNNRYETSIKTRMGTDPLPIYAYQAVHVHRIGRDRHMMPAGALRQS